ncbi:hypothetical protein F4804DRAFT_61559 [Jackrogersella minutella]|nr:hypothetical protein F4804DRAFT_61559 [Jackrogersella minutella]
MTQGSRSALRRYAQVVRGYNDNGEGRHRAMYSEPFQIFDAVDDLVNASGSKVLSIQLPHTAQRFLNLSHEIMRSIRDVRHHPCTFFFGGTRPFQQYPTPQIKMLSLVASMITQLIELVPKTFEDTTDDELSEQKFINLQLACVNYGESPISILGAIDIIKALISVIPHHMIFFFAGCDRLTSMDGDEDPDLAWLLSYLLRCLVSSSKVSRVRKILWFNYGSSTPLNRVRQEVISPQDYITVTYPRDWNGGRKRI